jgi:hypothetical protein
MEVDILAVPKRLLFLPQAGRRDLQFWHGERCLPLLFARFLL